VVSWLFLGASIWGALFTANALRPIKRPWPLTGLSFFPAWLTTELALHHIVWQSVASAIFVYLGALTSWPGQVGAAITLLSWAALAWLFYSARGCGPVVRAALDEALGAGFTEAIEARHLEHMRDDIEWDRVLWPFRVGHHEVERIADLPYVDDGDPRHTLDVYRRRDLAPGAPILMQIHGGAWMVGSKKTQGQPLLQHLAARGWLCVAINYRLSPRATWPDHLVDCKRALAWIRTHAASYGGDPGFVIVTGGSAGGHLAAMVALTPNDPTLQPGFEEVDTEVQGLVPFYGVFDWTDRFGYRGKRDPMKSRLERYIAKAPFDSDVYHRASPMSHVGPHVPPTMILHGTNDTLAPVAEARHFAEMLREVSNEPVVYAEFAGAHHAFEIFPSVRALHAIHGVEAFAAWVASRHAGRIVTPDVSGVRPISSRPDASVR
jgi:acetyl esterase/lipase